MMLRLLLIAFIGWLVWRILRPVGSARRAKSAPTNRVENMRACAHCGVYALEREMLADADGRWYCCDEHKRLGQGKI
jgi:hypothetical protein